MKLGSSGMISTALILFEEELFYVDIILFSSCARSDIVDRIAHLVHHELFNFYL
jgi:hypothetical protein